MNSPANGAVGLTRPLSSADKRGFRTAHGYAGSEKLARFVEVLLLMARRTNDYALDRKVDIQIVEQEDMVPPILF